MDYVLAHHWLFRSVTSFVSVRGYSGGLFIRIHAVLTRPPSSSGLSKEVASSSPGLSMFRNFIQTDGVILPKLS
jgi:hypothetical protein